MFIANWKMNGSEAMLEDWLKGVSSTLDSNSQNKCILCPPVCFLSQASRIIRSEKLNISLGAQNIDSFNFSSLTGGINGSMLKELGSEYVIIGHSERREAFKEGNQLLLDKLNSASQEGLKVIFCIGESSKQKEQDETLEVLNKQLEIVDKAKMNEFMIAYEPIWAIGSGQTAKRSDVKYIHKKIIEEVNSFEKKGFLGVSYGGSVDASSSKDFIAIEEVQGLLIGGASLKYEDFCNIVLNSGQN